MLRDTIRCILNLDATFMVRVVHKMHVDIKTHMNAIESDYRQISKSSNSSGFNVDSRT